jgi:DNA-binding NarL/FixJ family response regulator
MGRQLPHSAATTEDRRSAGHRREVREIKPSESARLTLLFDKAQAADSKAHEYVLDLYDRGVSQASIGRARGVSQSAIHLMIKRIYRRGHV